MATSSLRDKFKLLRQWQMQQQEEFEKIKMEHSMKFTTYGNPAIGQMSEPLNFSNDKEDMGGTENIDDEGQTTTEFKGESVPSADQNLLKRMSSHSLEQALTLAVSELQSQHGLIAESDGIELQHSNESSDGEENGNAYFANDSWDGNAKLQTAIFKENLHRSPANVELFSDGEAASEGASDMDGFYPITYSEDNASEGKIISDDNHDDEADGDNYNYEHLDEDKTPFDEKPVQSMIRQGVVSFEEMIERQLEDEKKAKDEKKSIESHPPQQKKFLRKGEGTARFTRGIEPKKGAKVGYIKEHGCAPLPKTSLKLIAEPTLRVGKAAEIASNDGQLLEEPNLKKETLQDKHLVMENLPRKDFSYQQPLPSDSIGFQRHSATAVDSSIEASFQNMLKTKYIDDKVADDELAEFELLEKAALDTSISSNASSILKLVSASRANFLRLNTSSPIPKSHLLTEDLELENDVDEVLEKIDDNLSPAKEDADIKRGSGFDVNEDQFLDHSEWDDTVHSSDALDDGDSTIVGSPKTKKVPDASQPRARDSSPPTSQLMKKFFPTLASKQKTAKQSHSTKSQIQKSKENFSESTKENIHPNTGKENIPPSMQADVLKSKLVELEHEISRFQKENATLEKLRVEKEKELNILKNEVQQFQLQRAEELEKIENFREEEMQKLRREKKTFEKYQKAVRSAPNKKEREEIEALKKKVNQLQENMKHRETKWNSSASRFRKRIESLENENNELKESINLLEKERIQRWGKDDSKSLEVKERRVNKLPNADVKQAVTEALVVSDPSQQCIDHRLEINSVSTMTKSASKKSLSPRNETVRTKSAGRTEVSPRVDIAPSEHPEIPRGSEEYSTRDITEKANVRLSLTPERKQASAEKTLQINSQLKHQDGKVERVLPDGSREIIFPNGTKKTIDPITHHTVVSFFNGDIKQIFPDDRTTYFYAESKTTHTTYKDGTEVYEFANGQSEKHYLDGRKVITFHDQTVKCIFADGAEETVFADGTIQNVDINGQRTISFPNGQREIHTQNFKRREYPDGTVKTVYQDGRQETRYSTGRIRIKDQFGNVVLDSGLS